MTFGRITEFQSNYYGYCTLITSLGTCVHQFFVSVAFRQCSAFRAALCRTCMQRGQPEAPHCVIPNIFDNTTARQGVGEHHIATPRAPDGPSVGSAAWVQALAPSLEAGSPHQSTQQLLLRARSVVSCIAHAQVTGDWASLARLRSANKRKRPTNSGPGTPFDQNGPHRTRPTKRQATTHADPIARLMDQGQEQEQQKQPVGPSSGMQPAEGAGDDMVAAQAVVAAAARAAADAALHSLRGLTGVGGFLAGRASVQGGAAALAATVVQSSPGPQTLAGSSEAGPTEGQSAGPSGGGQDAGEGGAGAAGAGSRLEGGQGESGGKGRGRGGGSQQPGDGRRGSGEDGGGGNAAAAAAGGIGTCRGTDIPGPSAPADRCAA